MTKQLAGTLGNRIVLAVEAAEVASWCGKGIGPAPGLKVKERLFLNRIDMLCNHVPIAMGIQGTVPVFPYRADPPPTGHDSAAMPAKPAEYNPVRTFFVETSLSHTYLPVHQSGSLSNSCLFSNCSKKHARHEK
jgi:hypothetical protein